VLAIRFGACLKQFRRNGNGCRPAGPGVASPAGRLACRATTR
jgi:hypothetical protein